MLSGLFSRLRFTTSAAAAPRSPGSAASSQALPLERLEALAEALLHFSGPADLVAWVADHAG